MQNFTIRFGLPEGRKGVQTQSSSTAKANLDHGKHSFMV